jgi:hypothetical protein
VVKGAINKINIVRTPPFIFISSFTLYFQQEGISFVFIFSLWIQIKISDLDVASSGTHFPLHGLIVQSILC